VTQSECQNGVCVSGATGQWNAVTQGFPASNSYSEIIYGYFGSLYQRYFSLSKE
jgi:hypothetical protein